LVNPMYAQAALDALADGVPAAQAIERITAGDEGRAHRQVHLIGMRGGAAYTGASCVDWCGHVEGEGFSVAGNMLAGRDVLDATADAFQASPKLPLAERLIAALMAGQAKGGDKRGKQAAALLIHATEDYPALDLRVDDHAEPIAELQRLYEKSLERYQPFTACLPSRRRPAGITNRSVIEAEIERFHARRRGTVR
jgi:uncharacterized Ntn-hydrolase superfamily protein